MQSNGAIVTAGDYARGILAQSVGGGGGTGGVNVSGVLAKNRSAAVIGVGGFGGDGGNAGSVSVQRGSADELAGVIVTSGAAAFGIEASSIGGGGGDAGANLVLMYAKADAPAGETPTERKHPKHTGVDEDVFKKYDNVLDELEARQNPARKKPGTSTPKSTYAAQIAIGGSGGSAGNGGTATVDNYGDIVTTGGDSHGIIAQSVGGGGGNARLNLAMGTTGDSRQSRSLNVAIGGGTGEGGTGGEVEVRNHGQIDTFGRDAFGIVAQSIGGGGGNAGTDVANADGKGGSIDIKLGRQGGSGGEGGDVTVVTDGDIHTRGEHAHAVMAQSVGNGGGSSSSYAFSLQEPAPDSPKDAEGTEYDFELGIEGGPGGAAGDVTVTAGGTIVTDGERSHGIFAQSVGGGGGEAGGAGGGEMAVSSVSFMMGGSGGTGGSGGDVAVTTSAAIHTHADSAIGVLAQSVGGGGGSGGEVIGVGRRNETGGFYIGVGGLGGNASGGGVVDVINSGTIVTEGVDSYGVLAQSIAGGGGNAGSIIRGLLNQEAEKDMDVDISMGGAGGTGGIADRVDVLNTGTIVTNGRNAVGIFAQSVGGGGGVGSRVVSGSVSTKGAGTKINIGLGGDGGDGGEGGDVEVTNGLFEDEARDDELPRGIFTFGDSAHGILAMSVGGGGGSGGTAITANISSVNGGEIAANSFAFSIGGSGGEGGEAGTVRVTNNTRIETHGAAAHAIIAQSVGGGGGSGGLSLAGNLMLGSTNAADPNPQGSLAIGGSGGSGNAAADVSVANHGTIAVFGNGSHGILAQSVGGGGGNGGFAAALSGNLRTNPASKALPYQAGIGLGGCGGSGGDSGDVVVNNTGSIFVHGDNADGIFAQSVSGGGGTAGFSLSSPTWMLPTLALDFALGVEGASGTAGSVEVHQNGTIVTTGANSRPFFRQSVNGGGGDVNVFLDLKTKATDWVPETEDGADAINAIAREARTNLQAEATFGVRDAIEVAGGIISWNYVGDLVSSGVDSCADLVESIGGGGGSGTFTLEVGDDSLSRLWVALGSLWTKIAGGGDLTADRDGDVATLGDRSAGSLIQTIGGGGGLVNLVVNSVPQSASAANGALGHDTMLRAWPVLSSAAAASDDPVAGQPVATLELGATGSTQTDGGSVGMEYSGDYYTEGDRAQGLMVQSIGGGGGMGFVTGIHALGVLIGGTDQSAGDGGTLTLANSGAIQTRGRLAHGIVLQSIGGGGGAVFTDMPADAVQVTTRDGNIGDGGVIDLNQTGNVLVTGEGSIGILAQSLGGGGGLVDRQFADAAGGAGRSGEVTLTIDGTVAALGAGGVGIFAQSRGRDGQGAITIDVAQGRTVYAGSGGTAIWIDGGSSNHVTVRGGVGTDDGLTGMAFRGGEGDDVFDSYGMVVGEVDLGGGVNRLVSHGGATFVAGPTLRVGGPESVFVNHGTLSSGGSMLPQTVALAGSFEQAAGGESLVELDWESGRIDEIHATGRADVAGRVSLSLINPHRIRAGTFSMPIFSGDAGASATAAMLVAPESVVMVSALNNASGRAVTLDATVDFAPDDLSANLVVVGSYLNEVQNAGSSPHLADTIVRLLYESDLESYRTALTSLSPEFFGEHQAALIRGNQRFMEILLDRLPSGGEGAEEASWTTWMQHEREADSRARRGDYQATRRTTDRTSFGVQRVGGDWTCNVGVSLDSANVRGSRRNWHGRADTQQVGAAVRRILGQTALSASVGYAWDKTETRRAIAVTEPYEARSKRYLEIAGGLLGISHQLAVPGIADGRFWLRPALDLGFAQVSASLEHETGAGSQNLVLLDGNETHAWTTPRLEMGYRYTTGSGLTIEPCLDLGLQYYLSGPATEVRARLEVAPESVAGMRLPVPLGQGARHASLGVELGGVAPWSVRLSYHRTESSHGRSDAGELRGTFTF